MVIENIKDITEDLIHINYLIDTSKLQNHGFILTDCYTILNKNNNEIEICEYQYEDKKLVQITAIVETQSEGTLYYTNYYINDCFKSTIAEYRI